MISTRTLCAWAACWLGAALLANDAAGLEPNDGWADATNVGLTRTVVDQIDFTTDGPDTTLGVFDETGGLLAVDDDGSFFGNGLASALYDFPVNADGSVRFAVSGFADFNFDGLDDDTFEGHTESGDYLAFLTVYNEQGAVIDSRDFDDVLTPGEANPLVSVLEPEWAGGTFDLELLNFFGPPSDADFWLFTGAPAGVPFVAEIVEAEFDTLLGWYNDEGQVVDIDDESGVPPLSRLTGVVPDSGQVYLAVSAYPDFGFGGVHSAEGGYTLRLTVVPEPFGNTLIAVALIVSSAAAHRRRSKRSPARR